MRPGLRPRRGLGPLRWQSQNQERELHQLRKENARLKAENARLQKLLDWYRQRCRDEDAPNKGRLVSTGFTVAKE